jgi:hypothetical protein
LVPLQNIIDLLEPRPLPSSLSPITAITSSTTSSSDKKKSKWRRHQNTKTASVSLKLVRLQPDFQYPNVATVDKPSEREIQHVTSIRVQLMCIDGYVVTGIQDGRYLLRISIDDIYNHINRIGEQQKQSYHPHPDIDVVNSKRKHGIKSSSIRIPIWANEKQKRLTKESISMPTAEPLPVEPLDCFHCRQRCEPDGSAVFLKIPHPIPSSTVPTSKEQFRIYHPSIDKCRYYDSQTKEWHYKVCHSINNQSFIHYHWNVILGTMSFYLFHCEFVFGPLP